MMEKHFALLDLSLPVYCQKVWFELQHIDRHTNEHMQHMNYKLKSVIGICKQITYNPPNNRFWVVEKMADDLSLTLEELHSVSLP